MNGGSRSRVTSSAVEQAAGGADDEAEQEREQARHARVGPRAWPITTEREHHDRADREVDAGGQDDQRLGDAERCR